MSDIQFEEPQYGQPSLGPKGSWLARLVVRFGLAKDDASAQRVLLVILMLTIIATVLVWTL